MLRSLLLLGMIGSGLVFGPQAALAADDGSSNISVNVTDGSSPTPSSEPSSGSSGGGSGSPSDSSSSGGSTGTGGTGGTGSAPGGGAGAPTPAGEVSVKGMLYVGGLEASGAISPNPAEGVVTLSTTVRNASKSTFDAVAKFWMNSAVFRNDLDVIEEVQITALQPGETRAVSVQLHNGGQWTLIDAHVTITPPQTVDGTELTPVTRDATLFLFPWLIATVLVAGAVAFILVRVARSAVVPPILVDAT